MQINLKLFTPLCLQIKSTTKLRHFSLFVALLLVVSFAFEVYADTTNVMIVLDASGSMRGQIEGRTKMEIAKQAIREVLKTIPEDVRVGLRVYGHQSPRYKHDCKDSKLEVPLTILKN